MNIAALSLDMFRSGECKAIVLSNIDYWRRNEGDSHV